jgi:hypothetical protein
VKTTYKILTNPQQVCGLRTLAGDVVQQNLDTKAFELHSDDHCYPVASAVGTHRIVVVHCI